MCHDIVGIVYVYDIMALNVHCGAFYNHCRRSNLVEIGGFDLKISVFGLKNIFAHRRLKATNYFLTKLK